MQNCREKLMFAKILFIWLHKMVENIHLQLCTMSYSIIIVLVCMKFESLDLEMY